MDFLFGSRPKVIDLSLSVLCFAVLVQSVVAQKPRTPPATKQVQPSKPTPTISQLQQLLNTGQNLVEQGRLDDALRIYSQAIGLSLKDPRTTATTNLRIGSIYLAQRKPNEAKLSFERAVSMAPDLAEGHNYLGEALGELKDYPKALESFNRAISLDPTLLRARYNQGVTYARMGNTKYSEFVFRNLIKAAPEYSLAYDGLAVTLSRSGRAKEAIPMHEKAISLAPNEPSYYYNLGLSYLILGDTTKALEQQEKLRTIDARVADQLASVILKRRT
jgi:tetratricopeptide (TPR) repeat protein